MKLKDLKEILESKKYAGEVIIFNNYANCDFLVHQYIHNIIETNKFNRIITNSVLDVPVDNGNFLSVKNDNDFYICYSDSESELKHALNISNCAIIYTGNKLNDIDSVKDLIVDIPKLTDNQIKDYVYSRGEGVSDECLDYLIGVSGGDLFRLEKELDKITIFDEKKRDSIFKIFMKDNAFSDISNTNTFNLIDAIVKRKTQTAIKIYHELENSGMNEMGIISLLYNNIRNIIKIQLSPNPTPENTGLKPNQFWAVKKNNINYYHKDDLLYIFGLLTDMDKKIKTGEIPIDKSIDYLLVHILR